MGLKKNDQPIYVNLSEGKFYESEDKAKENPYGSLEGYITSMSFRDDTFENQKIRKCVLTLNDGEQNYMLNVRTNSSYFGSLISFLKNADLKQPLTLKPGMKKDKNDKSVGTLFVQQNGAWLKAYYTKDNPNGLPPFKKVKINNQVAWDKTDYLEFLENVVEKEFKPNLAKVSGVKPSGLTAAPKEEKVEFADTQEVADDLPF